MQNVSSNSPTVNSQASTFPGSYTPTNDEQTQKITLSTIGHSDIEIITDV